MRCTRQLRQNLLIHFAEHLDLWLINYYSSQLRFAHQGRSLYGRLSAAFRWVWCFSSDESVCPRSAVDLDSGDELMPTKCPHSSHPSNLQDRTLVLLSSTKIMTKSSSTNLYHVTKTRRDVNAGHVTMTIIKCIMQYRWRIEYRFRNKPSQLLLKTSPIAFRGGSPPIKSRV